MVLLFVVDRLLLELLYFCCVFVVDNVFMATVILLVFCPLI